MPRIAFGTGRSVRPDRSRQTLVRHRRPSTVAMRCLQVAFVDERVVRATYRKEGGEATRRRLEPHALLIDWPAWYLLAHGDLRGAGRTFRLDRFDAVEIEETTFRARGAQLADALRSATGAALERV